MVSSLAGVCKFVGYMVVLVYYTFSLLLTNLLPAGTAQYPAAAAAVVRLAPQAVAPQAVAAAAARTAAAAS
jgi:hypothetical protein